MGYQNLCDSCYNNCNNNNWHNNQYNSDDYEKEVVRKEVYHLIEYEKIVRKNDVNYCNDFDCQNCASHRNKIYGNDGGCYDGYY